MPSTLALVNAPALFAAGPLCWVAGRRLVGRPWLWWAMLTMLTLSAVASAAAVPLALLTGHRTAAGLDGAELAWLAWFIRRMWLDKRPPRRRRRRAAAAWLRDRLAPRPFFPSGAHR